MKPLWKSRFIYIIKLAALLAFMVPAAAAEKEIALWGGTLSRNMVSDEKNIPASWDLELVKISNGPQNSVHKVTQDRSLSVGRSLSEQTTKHSTTRNSPATAGTSWHFANPMANFCGNRPTPNSPQVGSTTGPCREFVPHPLLKAIDSTISLTVVRSSVLIPRASLMVKTTVPLRKKPKQARLMATSSGVMI